MNGRSSLDGLCALILINAGFVGQRSTESGGRSYDIRKIRYLLSYSNIERYQRLLETHLTDFERKYIERRLSQE